MKAHLRRRRGHTDFLFMIALAGMVIALLVPVTAGLLRWQRGLPPPQPNPHAAEFAHMILCGMALLIFALFAEAGAEVIHLGVGQRWQTRRVFLGVRKGLFDRIVYFAGGTIAATVTMWLVGASLGPDILISLFFSIVVIAGGLVWWFSDRLSALSSLTLFGVCVFVFGLLYWAFVLHASADPVPTAMSTPLKITALAWLYLGAMVIYLAYRRIARVAPKLSV